MAAKIWKKSQWSIPGGQKFARNHSISKFRKNLNFLELPEEYPSVSWGSKICFIECHIRHLSYCFYAVSQVNFNIYLLLLFYLFIFIIDAYRGVPSNSAKTSAKKVPNIIIIIILPHFT